MHAQFTGQCAHGRGFAARRNHVRHQTLVIRLILTDHHRGLPHPFVGEQHGFHLTRLDPEPADLDLVIRPSHELQPPAAGPAHHVPGPVHPATSTLKRAGCEPLGGQARTVQVTPGQPGAGHVQLTRHAHRHRIEEVVEDVHPSVVQRVPDETAYVFLVRHGRVEPEVADMHGGLGDAVHVHQHRRLTPVPGVPLPQPAEIKRLTAEHHQPQRQLGTHLGMLPVGLHELVERRRSLAEHRHPLPRQHAQELPGGARDVKRNHHQAPAVQQRAPQLPHREVKRKGMEPGPHVPAVETEPLPRPLQKGHHIRMSDRNTLGSTGRSRGIDHIGRVFGPEWGTSVSLDQGVCVLPGHRGPHRRIIQHDPLRHGQSGMRS
ncbi:hypothetical protein GCM10010376_57670 [Streptomyces violaceusniger]